MTISDVADHLDSLKLFGEKRRFVESLSGEAFDFNMKIEKLENTIGIGLSSEFRGGQTCIGTVEGIGVGVRIPNTMQVSVETKFSLRPNSWNIVLSSSGLNLSISERAII